MLEKIAAFAKTKAAIALLGVAVVGGGGGAVAVAATTGHLSTMGVNLNVSHSDTNEGDHTSVEGLLTGCTGSSVSVKDRDGKSWTFNTTSTTKFNGDVKGDTQGDSKAGASTEKPDATEVTGTETGDHSGASTGDSSTGDSSAKGTETGDHAGSSTGDHSGASTGDSSAKGTESDHAGSSTGSSSDHAGSSTSNDSQGDAQSHQVTLAQICAAANINTRDVQVQGTKTSNGYDADKVTLQGPGSAKNDGSSSNEGSTSHAGASTGADSSEGGSSTAKP